MDVDIENITLESDVSSNGEANDLAAGKALFNYSDVNLCEVFSNPENLAANLWIDFQQGTIGARTSLTIPLLESSLIDGVMFYDGSDNDMLKIQFDMTDNNQVDFTDATTIDYETRETNKWVSFANMAFLFNANGNRISVHNIRLERASNKARIGKFAILCNSGPLRDAVNGFTEEEEIVKDLKIEKVNREVFRVKWTNPYSKLDERLQPKEVFYTIEYAKEMDRDGKLIEPRSIFLEKTNKDLEIKLEVFDSEYIEFVEKGLLVIKASPTVCVCEHRIERRSDNEEGSPIFREIQDLEYSGITVYPNPTFKKAWIETEKSGYDMISIYRLDGTKVKNLPLNSESTVQRIDIRELPDGLYILQIQGEGLRPLSTKLLKGNY